MENSILFEKNMQMLSLAVKYCEEKLNHADMIEELYKEDDLKKQYCIISLDKIINQKEADILVYNLTGKAGPIRESASFKILEFINNSDYKNFFQTKEILDTFVKAITDINPSVSRNIVRVITFVDDIDYLYEKIIIQTKQTLKNMESIKQNRSYNTNKQNFSLYWNLEAIINISDKIKTNKELLEILETTAQSNDYTIREKTAKTAKSLLNKFEEFSSVLKLLENDTNVYVKKYL